MKTPLQKEVPHLIQQLKVKNEHFIQKKKKVFQEILSNLLQFPKKKQKKKKISDHLKELDHYFSDINETVSILEKRFLSLNNQMKHNKIIPPDDSSLISNPFLLH